MQSFKRELHRYECETGKLMFFENIDNSHRQHGLGGRKTCNQVFLRVVDSVVQAPLIHKLAVNIKLVCHVYKDVVNITWLHLYKGVVTIAWFYRGRIGQNSAWLCLLLVWYRDFISHYHKEKIIANEPQRKYSPDCGFYDLMLLYYVEKLSVRGRILCLYPNCD